MATMPAASPSSPSIRLTAFAMPTTQITVTSGARSGDSTTRGARQNGTRKNSMVSPKKYSTVPARTWPDILAGGDTSRRSSTMPTVKITAAAEDHAERLGVAAEDGSELLELRRHRTWRRGRPTNMAAPPASASAVRGPGARRAGRRARTAPPAGGRRR